MPVHREVQVGLADHAEQPQILDSLDAAQTLDGLGMLVNQAVIGIALITESLSHGGVISPRGLLGLLFIAAGVLRLRLSRPNDGEPQG